MKVIKTRDYGFFIVNYSKASVVWQHKQHTPDYKEEKRERGRVRGGETRAQTLPYLFSATHRSSTLRIPAATPRALLQTKHALAMCASTLPRQNGSRNR